MILLNERSNPIQMNDTVKPSKMPSKIVYLTNKKFQLQIDF